MTPMLTLTSMTDMFMMILVFLLNFLDPDAATPRDVELPSSVETREVGRGATLTVGRGDVRVGDRRVLALDDSAGAPAVPPGVARTGRRIDALHEALVDALPVDSGGQLEASDPILIVACDRRVPFSVLGDILYTAGQAGFGQFNFVVISDPE